MGPEKIKSALADITGDWARKLIAVILTGGVAANWNEVRRLAKLPEYRNLGECEKIVKEVADELQIKNPLHSD
jgi:hypothetical protein